MDLPLDLNPGLAKVWMEDHAAYHPFRPTLSREKAWNHAVWHQCPSFLYVSEKKQFFEGGQKLFYIKRTLPLLSAIFPAERDKHYFCSVPHLVYISWIFLYIFTMSPPLNFFLFLILKELFLMKQVKHNNGFIYYTEYKSF